MEHASDCARHNMPAYPAGPCDCISPADKDHRIDILEDRIRYALDLIGGGYIGEAILELERVFDDPSMLPPYSTINAEMADGN